MSFPDFLGGFFFGIMTSVLVVVIMVWAYRRGKEDSKKDE